MLSASLGERSSSLWGHGNVSPLILFFFFPVSICWELEEEGRISESPRKCLSARREDMAVLESESESDDIPLARQIPKAAAAAAAAAPAPAVKREEDTVVNQTKAKGTKKVKTTSKPVGAKKKVKEEEENGNGKAKRPKYEMPGQVSHEASTPIADGAP